MRKSLYILACMALLACPAACKKTNNQGSDSSAVQTTSSPADMTTTSGNVDNPAGSSGVGAPDSNQPTTPVGPGSTTPPEINGSGTNPNPDSNGNPANANPAPPNPSNSGP